MSLSLFIDIFLEGISYFADILGIMFYFSIFSNALFFHFFLESFSAECDVIYFELPMFSFSFFLCRGFPVLQGFLLKKKISLSNDLFASISHEITPFLTARGNLSLRPHSNNHSTGQSLTFFDF